MLRKLLLVFLLSINALYAAAQSGKLIVGTYTNKGNSEGIYVYDFDSKTAHAKQVSIIKNVFNPSYLALSKNSDFLYSVYEDGTNSAASAFRFNATTGEANFLNKEATKGSNPCFILTDGKNALTANYSGGSISVFGIKADGSLTSIKQNIQHIGSGPDKRQASAHVHQVLFSPDKKYVIATDLGEDKVYVYHYQADAQAPLTLKQSIKTNAGTGPRHLTFSPNGKFAYLAHEFNGKISVFSYNDGNLSLLQEVATVAKDFTGKIDAADIHLSADGRFLYESNRGDATAINVFAVQKNGKLSAVETVSSLGKGPRNFTIDPSGKYLLVAHQYTNNVVIFNRNTQTGKLTDSGKQINVGTPVCLVFSK
ncbi:lactonase family protein [Pedobacter sp. UBA4863]|uniref:lactonase family protein n=1 Tax=Pedobacter sp. UBA4863 TaxID=1947060 RepID=UPI0025EC750E|nr:lactonase family protein [Pedobacter sp. UBA4863]